MEEGEIGELPDELRCRRSDGRQWRCKKRVLGEFKMCEYHLHRIPSAGKGKGKSGRSVTDDQSVGLKSVESKLNMEKEVEETGTELGDEVREEKKRLEVGRVEQPCSVSASGRKRKRVKRYGDDDDEDEGLNLGNKKKEGNVSKKNKKKDVMVVKRVALDEESVPAHLRCVRSDGRRWRCNRRVKDGVTLCENHYIQGRLRQVRAAVPESLKLQRRDRPSLFKCSQLRISKIGGGKKRKRVKWRQWSKFSEALDDALRKLQLKKSDMELQLLKAYLKRQAEKMEMHQHFVAEGYCHEEVTKDLPFGEMTISASPALQNSNNAGTTCNLKIGSDPDSLSGVSFRSKNIEPLPIASSKVIPSVKEMAKVRRAKKRCHLCNKSGSHMFKCSACEKEFFCVECIKERYSTSREDVEKLCPVCFKECSCDACLVKRSKDAEKQEDTNDGSRWKNVARIHQLIYLFLPMLKHIKDEKTFELESDEKSKGKYPSEVGIQQVEDGCDKQIYCKNCKSCIVDVHGNCENCSYSLCLSCYRDLSEGLMKGVCCPTVNFGGYGHFLPDLNQGFSLNWINDLEESAAKAVSGFNYIEGMNVSSCTGIGDESETINQVQLASSRRNSNDNFLYYPSIEDGLGNFHKHWQKHHPIVVRNVLHQSSELCWDPIFFFCSYLERCSADSPNPAEVEASNFLNWCEVEIGIRQSYFGQMKGWNHANMWDETLKLKGRLSSLLFQYKFPDHYDRIVHSLPYQEYMNPVVGKSNLAVNLPLEVKPDLGPHIHISYGYDLNSVDAMGKLCYNTYDSVNIMVHATEIPVPSEQVSKVRKLMERKWYEYQEASARKTSDVTTSKGKGKLSNKGDNLKGVEILNKDREKGTTCEGESGESCNSIVAHSGRSVVNVNRQRESGSDSEASNICSGNSVDTNIVQYFGNCDLSNGSPSASSGAEWDVFRREDIPALVNYLKNHSDKFSQISSISKNCTQNIPGQVFLDSTDKARLKEEFNVEPWTFKQKVGEAVIVPAGCPYQIRTLKSCMSVAFDFLSPESASASIHLSDEVRLLPKDLLSSEDRLEVKKMVLYSISAALHQLSELCSAS